MKWKTLLNQKFNTGLALFSVLIMMFLLSFVHKRNLTEMHSALSSIHQDRLVAENHLYKLSQKVYEKKLTLDQSDAYMTEQHVWINDTIQQLINKFEATYLTTDEAAQFSALKDHLRIAQQLELQFTYGPSAVRRGSLIEKLSNQYNSILVVLNGLTTLQLDEGQKLIDQSNRIVASNTVTLRMEIGLFLVFALLIFLMFSTVTSYRKVGTSPGLN
jgi:hypothetical protein